MKKLNKLYEYVVSNHLGFNFIKRVSIDEETKIVWFEFAVINNITDHELTIIKSKREITFEKINKNIKDFLFRIIRNNIVYLICKLKLDSEIENIFNDELDNGFVINGKEFLLKDNNYAELREKVLKEVKQYELH